MNVEDGVEIAAAGGFSLGQAAPADPQLLAIFAAGRDSQLDRAIEGGNREFCAKHGFPRREIEVVIKVRALSVEIWVSGVAHSQIEIARRRAAAAGFALAGDADAFAIGDSRRDPDLEGLGLDLAAAGVGGLEGNRADGAVHGFLESDEDITLDVAALACPRAAGCGVLRESIAAGTAEVLLEKIAETGAAEVEFPPGAGCVSRLPPGLGVLPIRAECIIFFALLRVAQDLVGFVDFLKLGLCGFLVLGHVRVVFPREFAKGFFDVGAAGIARDTEGLVVVFEVGGHEGEI